MIKFLITLDNGQNITMHFDGWVECFLVITKSTYLSRIVGVKMLTGIK